MKVRRERERWEKTKVVFQIILIIPKILYFHAEYSSSL